MDKERATYTKTVPDNLVQIVGGMKYAGVAMLAIRLNAFADGDEARVSIPTLCDIFSCSVNTIKEYARRLSMLDIWQMTTIHGRGNVAVWKKGSNFDTYTSLKPSNFDGFTTTENHQTLTEKPSNFDGYNIDNNKAAERASEHAPAAENAAADGDPVKRSPRQGRKEKKMIDKQFQEFWMLFNPKDEFVTRKERCKRVWYVTSPEWREAILNELRDGKRKHRDNPLHYLQYYTPSEVKPEFPIFRNGEAALGEAMKEAETGGRAIAYVEAGSRLHIPDNFAYVYLTDAVEHGLTIKWTVPKNAQQTQVNNQ